MSYGRGRYFVYARNIRVKVQEEPSGRWIAHYARTGDGSKRTVNGQVFGASRKELFKKMRVEISAHTNREVNRLIQPPLKLFDLVKSFHDNHPNISRMMTDTAKKSRHWSAQ